MSFDVDNLSEDILTALQDDPLVKATIAQRAKQIAKDRVAAERREVAGREYEARASELRQLLDNPKTAHVDLERAFKAAREAEEERRR